MLSFVFDFASFILFYCKLTTCSNNDTKKQSLLDHLIKTTEHRNFKMYIYQTEFNVMYQNVIKTKASKLAKLLFPKSFFPTMSNCCSDWRHDVFTDDYFKEQRSDENFRRAAERYKKIVQVSEVIKKAAGRFMNDAYLNTWLSPDVGPFEPELIYSLIFQMPKDMAKVAEFKESKVYDFVRPKQQFSGIILENGLTLVNKLMFPVFVYDHSLVKGKVIDNKHSLHCLVFKNKQCACGRWVDWTLPLYNYHQIFCLWRVINQIEDQNSLDILSILISLTKSTNALEMLQDSKIISKIDLIKMMAGYKSNMQIIKDMWPSSDFQLVVFNRKEAHNFVKKSVNHQYNTVEWIILHSPVTLTIYEMARTRSHNDRLLFNQEQPFQSSFKADMYSAYNQFFILKPDFELFKDRGFSNFLNYENCFFSVAEHLKILYRAHYLAGNISEVQYQSEAYRRGDAFDQKTMALLQDETFLTAIKWSINGWCKPTPTIDSLITLAKIMCLCDKSENNQPPISQKESTLDFMLESRWQERIKSRLVLLALLYNRPEVSKRSREIWVDVLRNNFVAGVFHSFSFSHVESDNSDCSTCYIKVLPFSFDVLTTENVVLLKEKCSQYLPVYWTNDIVAKTSFYLWDNSFGQSFPQPIVLEF